jgi:hypothetical protein
MGGDHPIYSRDATVWVVTGSSALATMAEAIDQSRLLEDVERRWEQTGKPREEFAIVIKTDFAFASVRDNETPPYTDPVLVGRLADALRGGGFDSVTVVDSTQWTPNGTGRPPLTDIAATLGYDQTRYRIEGLAERGSAFDFGSLLGRRPVATVWLRADYRISFAKCRTDPRCFYATCIANLLGCLPDHGEAGATFYERAVLVADRTPAHFGFLDAWVSRDGLGSPNLTRSVVASPNLLALDWVAGEMMDLDPALNLVVQEGLHRWGQIAIVRRGNLTPWHPWRNVARLVVFVRSWIDPASTRVTAGPLARALGPTVTRRTRPPARRRRAVA